jgi:hypothetical protein
MDKKYNAANNLLCMNARIERAINFENLGARIMQNGALVQKIRGLEAFRGKMGFLVGSGAILEFLVWLEGLGIKDRGSWEVCEFFGDFYGFLDCVEWFRIYL